MLLFLAGAQIGRRIAPFLDMQADGVFVEFGTRLQIHHVQDDVAASDDVERRIEDVLWNGHQESPNPLSMRGIRLQGFMDIVALPTGFLVVDLDVK